MATPPQEESTPAPAASAPLDAPGARKLIRRYVNKQADIARDAAESVAEDSETAIHEFRKANRRSLAALRALRPHISKKKRKKLRKRLKKQMAHTGDLRDTDVLLATLRSLSIDDDAQAAFRKASAQILGLKGYLKRWNKSEEALEEGKGRIKKIRKRFEKTLPSKFRARDLREGLKETYRAARDAQQEAIETRDPEDVHTWRKRTKEVRYQVDMLRPYGTDDLHYEYDQLKSLARELGEYTDLKVLREFVEDRNDVETDASMQALLTLIDGAMEDKLDRIVEDTAESFSRKPGRFSKDIFAATTL